MIQPPLINVSGLCKEFRGGIRALNDINLSVNRGEVVVILGPSGSGKSTLIRCINGLEETTSGEIKVEGKSLAGNSERKWRNHRLEVGMVFQNYALFPHLNVIKNITLAPLRAGVLKKEEAVQEARRLLELVGLAAKENSPVASLSGGQQQRIAICRALAMKPKAILFDEPTSALDPEMVGEVLSVMRRLADEGVTMICVTHEMGFAKSAADRIVFMDKGEIVEEAPPQKFFSAPESDRSRRFLDLISSHHG
ncbi:amino acid ABC transporter ATP-binding protein, PAAT family [Marinobacterium lutimaris]|uniref:Amino acid ABC transporter ATP-binding protein, PAAT family n=1 Tax=Marinobacterium lutimaris TaxID=568106 RepID=A0A1H6CCE1_9GAMM|nr:amino acid ABC transporter ATP-binding protein, PAAT family [Marinobacterium lutimaris]